MPRTEFQDKVVQTKNTNLIVSAGAGSGKTSTLTDRVIDIIQSGTSINNILVLTFTNAASSEMKDRIRAALVKAKMYDELAYLDSSYICTFDSFALSIVKKYHYVLGLDKHIDICEDSLISVISKKMARLVLDEEYQANNSNFDRLVNEFLIKDDNLLLEALLSINKELDKIVNKKAFIESYLASYSSSNKLNDYLEYYSELVQRRLYAILNAINLVYNESDETLGTKIIEIMESLKKCNSYEEIYEGIMNLKFPRKNKNCSEQYDDVKKVLTDELKKLKALLVYEELIDFKDDYNKMLMNASIIMPLVAKLNDKIEAYKKERKLYTFYDIAKMAIELLETHEEIRRELKDKFKEIMIDEYQDTSDIQESLINLLSSNNVCVVGDIKQSIYRFRNANPIIFKEKYDTYGKIENSKRIDLLDNFRSRKEVVEDVNFIFSDLMRDKAGGANYKDEHLMVFGNKLYEANKAIQDYHMEVLNYKDVLEDNKKFLKGEIEAFIIANDIKEKIETKYQIFDTKNKEAGLRDAKYSDFCILMPTSTNFSIFRRVFEYFGIPLGVLKNESLIEGDEILSLKNLCLFIKSIYTKEFNEDSVETKYQYLSVARSFLFEEDDQSCFDVIDKNLITETEIYKKSAKIARLLNVISITEFIDLVIEEFDFVSKFNKKGGISKMLMESEYLHKLSNSLAKANIDIDGFIEYLQEVLENKIKIEFSSSDYSPEANAVKMMVIHKSKGLEFQVCYLASNYSKYNERDTMSKFIFSKELGLICPIFNFGEKQTFMKSIYKDLTLREERAEKIRLFYVAVTRAKEKVIIVDSVEDNVLIDSLDPESDILACSSFSKLMNRLYPKMEDRIKNVSGLRLTKDYLFGKNSESISKVSQKLVVSEYNESLVETSQESHFSKRQYKLIDKETAVKMEFGNVIHEIMECLDFKDLNIDKNIDSLNVDEYYKIKIKKFFENDIMKDINNAKVYKEYKFYTEDLESMGIIDLMIEYDDHIDIIDYKLKNINDEAYYHQLNAYKEYIKTISDKNISIYLYSIIEENLLKLV